MKSFLKYYIYEHTINNRLLRRLFISKFWGFRFIKKMKKSKINSIFVHIPKTGGTSISSLLPNNSIGHKKVSELIENKVFSKEDLSKIFKFCVIRNPLERIVSYYDYSIKTDGSFHEEKYSWKRLNRIVSEYPTFKEFAKNIKEVEKKYLVDIAPFSDYFLVDGKVMVDKIIEIRDLDSEFKEISRRYKLPGLPHLNKSIKRGYWKTRYDTETLDIIYNYYKKDFDFSDYQEQYESLKRELGGV
jgi:hypothetical protein